MQLFYQTQGRIYCIRIWTEVQDSVAHGLHITRNTRMHIYKPVHCFLFMVLITYTVIQPEGSTPVASKSVTAYDLNQTHSPPILV
jgi:hypothetical protein